MKSIVQLFVMAHLLMLSGCNATVAKNALPAVLNTSSSETVEAIQQAITSLTGMKNIKLADNVFSQKSTLIVERALHTDNQGRLLNGRSVEPADTFSLLVESGRCYLRHNQSDKIIELALVKCKAA